MNNAKITITVPYEEIPREVESLIYRSIKGLTMTLDRLKSGTTEDYKKIIEDIEYCRKKLFLVDANLQDSYHILLGYLKNEIDFKINEVREEKREENEQS